MDQNLAESLAARLKIAVEQVVREELELSLLKSFFESGIGKALVFKGGTALRLAFGSPRFSDDLDFSASSAIPEAAFREAAGEALKSVPEATLVEALAKRFTLFSLYRFDVPYIGRPFSIKIEVSTREESRRQAGASESELRLLSSEVTNLTVLARVATLERALEDKKAAFAARRQPRDLYDLWFISQKLGRPFQANLAGFDPRIVRRELRKYLPRTHWSVIDQWTG
jgi:predicted nucleotidyltransferase component of viral defense system